jgi:hypothetical protein
MVQEDTNIRELIERAINIASVMLPDRDVLNIRILTDDSVMINNNVFFNVKSSNRTQEPYGVYLYFNDTYVVYLAENEEKCKEASFKLINSMISVFIAKFDITDYPIDISVGYEDLVNGEISDGENYINIRELNTIEEDTQFKLENLEVYETGWKVKVWKEQ